MSGLVKEVVTAVIEAGPMGWIALISLAALALAGFAIYAILKITGTLKRKR